MNRYSEQLRTQTAAGWDLTHLVAPSALFGANGMRMGPDGQLYVVQAFGSQVSAVDTASGHCRTVSAVGGAIVAPDDIAFDSNGTMYVTEVMNARVSARTPDGNVRVIADDLPGANGITAYQDRLFMDECRPGGRLFELYPDGRTPRLIADDLPLPNALAVGPDGNLYFPEIAAGEIWRCPLSGGTPERFVAGLGVPTAVKFDEKGVLTTTQAANGEILKIDIQSGEKTVVATVRPGIDNLVIDPANRLFISHFIDGGVAEIQANGQERVLVPAGLLGPFGLAVGNDGTVLAADGMSLVAISPDGQVSRPAQFPQESFPGFLRGIAGGPAHTVYVTTSAGSISVYDLGSHTSQTVAEGMNELHGVALAPDGACLVAESGEGRLLKVTEKGEIVVVARGLGRPAGVAVGADGAYYVSEAGRGRVVRVNGGPEVVLDGLMSPQGLTVQGDQLLVLDAGSKELIAFSLAAKQRQTLASQLPVGAQPGITPKPLLGIPGIIPGPLSSFAGLAAGADGTVYVAADGEGSILALRRSVR